MSEVSGSDQNDQDHTPSTILPEMLTPPPEEFVQTTPPELQIPKAELPSPQDPPMLSMNTLTPPPEVDPSPAESLVTDNSKTAVPLWSTAFRITEDFRSLLWFNTFETFD